MIFAAILAGGIGSRMGGTDTPKQFLALGNKPVIIHTIEKFVINDDVDEIIVLTPKNFINHTNHLIEKYIPNNDNIVVIEGGETRNGTILNSISYIEESYIKDLDITPTPTPELDSNLEKFSATKEKEVVETIAETIDASSILSGDTEPEQKEEPIIQTSIEEEKFEDFDTLERSPVLNEMPKASSLL